MATAPRSHPQRDRNPAVVAVVVLSIATGVIHASIALEFFQVGLIESAAQFGGIAAAYVLGAALVALDVGRRPIIRAGVPFVAFVLGGWVLIGERSTIAYVDKVIEVILLGLLLWLATRPGDRADGPP